MAEMTRACSSSHDEGVLDCPCSAPAPLAPSYLDLEAKLLTGIEWLLDMAERTNHLVTPGSCLAQAERLRALAGGGK